MRVGFALAALGLAVSAPAGAATIIQSDVTVGKTRTIRGITTDSLFEYTGLISAPAFRVTATYGTTPNVHGANVLVTQNWVIQNDLMGLYSDYNELWSSFSTLQPDNPGFASQQITANSLIFVFDVPRNSIDYREDETEWNYYDNPQYFVVAYFDDNISSTFEIRIDAVPEPTTWAMLIFGFGLAGGVLRRKASTSFSTQLAGYTA